MNNNGGSSINGTTSELNNWIDLHPDEGCDHSPSCFVCPLADCMFTERKLVSPNRKSRTPGRDDEIVRRYEAGETAIDLAVAFKVGKRHVQRLITEARRLQ